MKKLGLLALLFAALLIILFVGRTDSQTPLTANDLGQIQMPPQTVLGNTLPVTGPLNAVPFSQFTGAISATIPTIIPPVTNGDCLKFAAPNSFADAGAPCNTGGGGGGGTVFSVGQSVPAGMSVTGSPITTSGTLAINWNGTIPNAQIPVPTPTALGGIETITCAVGQFVNVINASGVPSCSTPTGNVSTTGSPATGQCAQFTGATTITGLAFSCGAGSVTSVGATVPSGLAISGSPITTSGTLGITWSGTIPNAQVPTPTVSALGGVESVTCAGGQFVNGINTSGIPGCATPAGGGNVSTSGTITSGNCAQWNSTTTLISASAPCGSGGSSTGGFTNYINIKTYGAIGDGTCHPLSGTYANLAAAQVVYPFVSDLTQCTDWAAIQQAINVAYNTAPAGLFGPGQLSVYCPSGNYELSNPIIFDQPNNTAGTSAAWAVGTTYANAALVKYNGLPWVSAGSGNVGNPPTAYDLFPANIQPGGGGNYATAFPWAAVTITNASPAVITIGTNGGFGGGSSNVTANMPLVFFTQHYANPNTGTAPALPTGINANQVYYVVGSSISGNNFSVSTTPGGAAVNTSSAGVGTFFVSGQVWQIAPNGSSAGFSSRVSLIGEDGMSSNAGCIWQTQFNWTSPGVIVGPQNGNLIKNITLFGQVQGGSSGSPGNNGYRCTAPNSNGGPAQATGALVSSIGWAVMSNGGGASRTKFENVGTGGFYSDDYRGYGTNPTLVDHNYWQHVYYTGSCIGINFAESQAFINTVQDSTVGMATTGIFANLNEGAHIIGGDYSTFDALSNSFAITSVSTSSTCGNMFLCVIATITSPDNNLQTPMCAYSAGEANSASAIWLNAWPLASGCGYNTFIIRTAQWGLVGMYVMNYNPFTTQITLGIPKAYSAIYQGTCCGSNLATELAAATTLYAVEAVMPFFGDNDVNNIHVENDGVPYTLSCFCTAFFGGIKPAELSNIYMNAEDSLGQTFCCNLPITNKFAYRGLAQQVIPFINSSSGDTIIDRIVGGGDLAAPSTNNHFVIDWERVTIAVGNGNYVEARHTIGNSINNGQSTGSAWNAQGPLYDFYPRESYAVPLVGATQGQLSGSQLAYGGQAYGAGIWDNGSSLGPASAFSLSASGQPSDMANIWRMKGWGQAPQWGVRPAPWTEPCILPSQATTLGGALPAITTNSILWNFVQVASGGTGYAVNDTITLAGGTFSTAATLIVDAVSSGAVTSVHVGNQGSYSVEPATVFTQGSTTGGGTGATFTATGNIWEVNYTIGYPMLWGGQVYKACNYNDASFAGPKYAIKSTHQAWSYFQNLTTTNVPHMSWTMDGASPFIYMNYEALQLMFPGLQFNLTGTGGCSGTQNFIVLEVHLTMNYVKVVRADTDGSGFVPSLAASGTTCTGTTLGQASPALVNPY